jgi:hypothetical protein
MPGFFHSRCSPDQNIFWQSVVQNVSPTMSWDQSWRFKMSYLRRCMYTSIRTPSPMYRYWLPQYRLNRLFNFLLHRALPQLPLPTMKMSAQVLNYQGNSLSLLQGLLGIRRHSW